MLSNDLNHLQRFDKQARWYTLGFAVLVLGLAIALVVTMIMGSKAVWIVALGLGFSALGFGLFWVARSVLRRRLIAHLNGRNHGLRSGREARGGGR